MGFLNPVYYHTCSVIRNWPEKKRPASRLFTRTSTLEWQSLHRGEKVTAPLQPVILCSAVIKWTFGVGKTVTVNTCEQEPVEKLALLKSTKKDRELRRAAEDAEDADAVRRLSTPEGGRREQLLEEVLRQLQGDGPMERLQSALTSLDEKRCVQLLCLSNCVESIDPVRLKGD